MNKWADDAQSLDFKQDFYDLQESDFMTSFNSKDDRDNYE